MKFKIFLTCSILVHGILAGDEYYDDYAEYYDSLSQEAQDCSIYKDYDFR